MPRNAINCALFLSTQKVFPRGILAILLNLSIVDLLWQVICHITTLMPAAPRLFDAFSLPRLRRKMTLARTGCTQPNCARLVPGAFLRCSGRSCPPT